MGLVLIPRHVREEINYLTPANGSGIEQELTVGCRHRSSFIDLLLGRNSMDKVDRFFVESWGHLSDPFIWTYRSTYSCTYSSTMEGVNPFIPQRVKYLWSP